MAERNHRMFFVGQRRANVACPACGYVPVRGDAWHCAPDGCGALFDTFETRARCPECEARFSWTACPSCLAISPHEAWYRDRR